MDHQNPVFSMPSAWQSLERQISAFPAARYQRTLLIACSDAAADRGVQRFLEAQPSLVLRRPACRLPQADADSPRMSAVAYAVAELGVHDIVVCGHSLCDALEQQEEPWAQTEETWACALASAESSPLSRRRALEARHQREREHVASVVAKLQSLPDIQRAVENKELRLHGLFHLSESDQFYRYDGDRQTFSLV